MLTYSSYNFVIFLALLIALASFGSVTPATLTLLVDSLSCFALLLSMCMLFLPKIWIQISGKGVAV